MSEPVFLSVPEVEFLHVRLIERYGGTLGLRDRATLEAAVHQPQNVYFYGGGDFFDIAAAYAFHIAEAQAFLDGNKRAAMAAALVFLELNQVRAVFEWRSLYDALIAIAQKRFTRDQLADLLREQARAQK